MGIEYVDCLNENPHQRAIDLIEIIDQDLNGIISLMDDIVNTIIHFSEVGNESQFVFWSEVHNHVMRHYIMIPSNDLHKPDHMFI